MGYNRDLQPSVPAGSLMEAARQQCLGHAPIKGPVAPKATLESVLTACHSLKAKLEVIHDAAHNLANLLDAEEPPQERGPMVAPCGIVDDIEGQLEQLDRLANAIHDQVNRAFHRVQGDR